MSWLKPGPSAIFELTNSLSSLCHTLDLDGNVGLPVCNASNRVFCAGQISLLATDLRGGAISDGRPYRDTHPPAGPPLKLARAITILHGFTMHWAWQSRNAEGHWSPPEPLYSCVRALLTFNLMRGLTPPFERPITGARKHARTTTSISVDGRAGRHRPLRMRGRLFHCKRKRERRRRGSSPRTDRLANVRGECAGEAQLVGKRQRRGLLRQAVNDEWRTVHADRRHGLYQF